MENNNNVLPTSFKAMLELAETDEGTRAQFEIDRIAEIREAFGKDSSKAVPNAEKEPKLTAFEKFQQSKLNQLRDYPDPEPILSIVQGPNVIPVMTRKSYSLWQGKQKSKKTTALAISVSEILKYCHGIDSNSEDIRFQGACKGNVLFFDNEQGESYAARTMKLILKLAGLEQSEYLDYCDLREFEPKERFEIIKAGIESTPGCILVVIDGVVDLMDDFMDSKEGHTVVTDILRVCSEYDVHVAGVLHQNKGASKDARAHVGSISSQKCEKEIMSEVDPNYRSRSFISCKESRGIPFDDFAIEWNPGELPRIVQASVEELKSSTNPVRHKMNSSADFEDAFYAQMLSEIFTTDPKPRYSDLWQAIKAFMASREKKIGDNRSKEIVSYLTLKGLLVKPEGDAKYYQFKNQFSLPPI